MPLYEAGFEFALDLLTDATDGINKISIFTDTYETTKQTITFGAASGSEFSGTVVSSNTPLTFSITAGSTVQAIGLYHDTTLVGYIDVADVTDSNAYQYVVDSVTINLT